MDKIPLPRKNASCQMLLGDPKVTHHGHLRRRRTIVDSITDKLPILNWSSCYVVIHDGSLYIFSNERSKSPDEATSLFGFTKCYPCLNEVPAKVLWPFKLVNALSIKEKMLYFSASSETAMKLWIAVIRRELLKASGITTSGDRGIGNLLHSLESHSSASGVLERRASGCEDDDSYHGIPLYEKVDQSWDDFFWNGRPVEADKIIRNLEETGVFMVRKSSNNDNSMTLLVRAPTSVFKFKINFKINGVSLDREEIYFNSLNELITYYTFNSLPSCDVCIGRPYKTLQTTLPLL